MKERKKLFGMLSLMVALALVAASCGSSDDDSEESGGGTLAKVIEADTNGRYRLNMNEAIAMPGAYSIFKGAPAGAKAVNEFIRSCQKPERQVALFLCHGQTPSNPLAWPLIPQEFRRFAITLPENFNKVIPGNSEWWADNINEALNQFLDVIGG